MSRALAARYYTDPGVFAAELNTVFARSWVLVGHESQVARHGQVLTAAVGDESVFVVNNEGELGAYYNVCQHRGHELFPPQQTGGDELFVPGLMTCPYHAWVYSLDGRLANARSRDVGEIRLRAVRVERLAGFLYVNLDDDAPRLAEAAPGVESELLANAPQAPSRVLSWRNTHLIAANWKIAVENYNECFHCPNVHRSFTAGVVDAASYRIRCDGDVIRHAAKGAPPEQSGYTRLDEGADYVAYFVWPASAIQCYPGQVVNTFRWVPLEVDQTLLVREFWLDRAEPTEAQHEVIDLDWQTTATEDFGLVESVQRGIRSRGYRPGPLACEPSGIGTVHSEDSVRHLGGLLRDALGERRQP